MAELKIRDGDYQRRGSGLAKVDGTEALLQRVLFKLTARRGAFPVVESLGSRLWQLGQLPPSAREAAAKQYVAEALAEEEGVRVERVALTQTGDRAALRMELLWQGQTLPVTVELRM